jgi:uncharacterized protein
MLHKKIILIILSLMSVLLIVACFTVGWIASSQLVAVSHQKIEYDQTVTAVNPSYITTTGGAYNIQGQVGGYRSDGSLIGVFGPPKDLDDKHRQSTRPFSSMSPPVPAVGDNISLQGGIWTSDPKTALGLEYKDIVYDGPLGAMHAWLIAPSRDSGKPWTIGVHGIGADKTEMLRFARVISTNESPMLIINYRNDSSNPASPDGINHLGDSEWQDLQSAVAYAQKQGAPSVNLYGDSLGGSIVENYLRRGNNTQQIKQVILDSPALNWQQVISDRLKDKHVPAAFYYPTALVLKLRTGININELSTKPEDVKHKTLIIHSADDPNVPQKASKDLAAQRPDVITLLDVGKGGHLRSWNYDQPRYEKAITDFLDY